VFWALSLAKGSWSAAKSRVCGVFEMGDVVGFLVLVCVRESKAIFGRILRRRRLGVESVVVDVESKRAR
jgi:hypothetical protein